MTTTDAISALPSREAYDALSADDGAVLIDVRTRAEWSFVGIADLSAMGKQPILMEWQQFPAMDVDAQFASRLAAELKNRGADEGTGLYFICRSGARSLNAARAMSAAGFSSCFNVSDGFEGDLDAERHRGRVSGWKAAGLPWVQS
ncbi:rhodanese-like domain-containing protein [Tepidamorphus sp. 3E244]|uniref:rhodanese-like domain-containing protein n=1 Tax=Tepidamorphus sp. 3E244 TaxID=3385498 RepID=UPI0038FD3EC4